jgi:CheY-like chemotaxis protein
MGCRVVTAPNGRAAFRLFAQEKFDAILMDCEMPIMDGIEATRRIREVEAMAQGLPDNGHARRRTPIIALTAHALSDVRDKCLEAGMDDFLVKPFDDRQLAETLLRWLVPRGTAAEGTHGGDIAPPSRADGKPLEIQVIDRAVIDGLRALDRKDSPSRLDRAVSRFLESAPPLAAAIHDNCDKSNAEALWQAAHSLKSSAGALGAKQLALRCAEIELRARNSGVEQARKLVAALDEDLAAAIGGLQNLTGGVHVTL